MAAKLGIAPGCYLEAVRNLRQRGYEIEASSGKRVHLTYKPDLLDKEDTKTAPSFWPRPRREVAADYPGHEHSLREESGWLLILKPEMPLASVSR